VKCSIEKGGGMSLWEMFIGVLNDEKLKAGVKA